jgi:MoaA/NifB/PqqE/SkfB family radical SAM enzyme
MKSIQNLDIYITGACNYKCGYCYGENDNRGSMDIDTYKKAMEFGRYIGASTIQMCGGEPLVCPDFKSFVAIAREYGFNVTLRTNGVLVKEYSEFIAENCEWVGISVDGMPYENALMRTPRTAMTAQEQFDLPINAICELKRLNPKIKIILATLASKKNYSEIHKFAEYICTNKIPIDKWKIYEFIKDKFRSAINYKEYCMTESEFEAMVNSLDSYKELDIIIQSARADRVGGNCLIVYQNGDINILDKHYGNIITDKFDDIMAILEKNNALSVIQQNKILTYGGSMNNERIIQK